jgi:hypothetical protein
MGLLPQVDPVTAPRHKHHRSAQFAYDYFTALGVVVKDPMVYKQRYNTLLTFTCGIQAKVMTTRIAGQGMQERQTHTEFKLPQGIYTSDEDYVVLVDVDVQRAALISIQTEDVTAFLPGIAGAYTVKQKMYIQIPDEVLQDVRGEYRV